MLDRLKWWIGFSLLSALFAGTLGCGGATEESNEPAPSLSVPSPTNDSPSPTHLRPVSTPTASPSIGLHERDVPHRPKENPYPVVTIKTSKGDITLKLDAKKAPLTVSNFLENYVERGFYDQTIFHYVSDGVLIAGGGFTSDYDPKQAGAEILSEADNGLKNKRYTITMARHAEYINSATSQFYINLADNDFLDHQSDDSADTFGYCVFGEVTGGHDVLDRIAKVEVRDVEDFPSTPTEPIIIQSVVRIE